MTKNHNNRQKRLVDEFLIDFTVYKLLFMLDTLEKAPYSIGNENLKKPAIHTYIEKSQKARIDRTQITQDFVLMELMKIATANGTNFTQGHIETEYLRHRLMICHLKTSSYLINQER